MQIQKATTAHLTFRKRSLEFWLSFCEAASFKFSLTPRMSDSAEDDLGIRPETIIDSTKAKYVANVMLGKGGFGAVYKVHLEGDKSKEYAMKIEKKKATRKDSKLKMEIFILKNVAKLRQGKSHFTKIIDRGKKETYYFIVMDLVGKSLDDLKNSQPKRIFSLGTGLGFASQCLEATEDLHEQGCIHRDIKPENFAIGLGASKHIVYMLDFGIARKITKEDKELKTPRSAVGFKGTIRFASLACHKREEMGKKDDCESMVLLTLGFASRLRLALEEDRGQGLGQEVKRREPQRIHRRI
ncbi:Serine threonine protein kinase-related domain containing protein, protein [Aphelenchoides bicaudatus]|nr:Serine threonine protein kinase-related domain containing protein, protein [Aphelenchoides bicaudatus]